MDGLDANKDARSTSAQDHVTVDGPERKTEPFSVNTSLGFIRFAEVVPSDAVRDSKGASAATTITRIEVKDSWMESETVKVITEIEPRSEEDKADTSTRKGDVEEGDICTSQVEDSIGRSCTQLHS